MGAFLLSSRKLYCFYEIVLYIRVNDVGGHQKEIVTLHKGASPTREAFFYVAKQ